MNFFMKILSLLEKEFLGLIQMIIRLIMKIVLLKNNIPPETSKEKQGFFNYIKNI